LLSVIFKPFMLSVIMLNVVMLSVVAPENKLESMTNHDPLSVTKKKRFMASPSGRQSELETLSIQAPT